MNTNKETNIDFSVLMSVYKNDDPIFLRMALESIFNHQVTKPTDIVIVFDGPLNNELYLVLNDFRNGKENIVRFFPLEKNQGLGQALRIGINHCQGEYICRMDADDISTPDRFLKQIAYMQANPEIDVLGTDIAEFEFSIKEEMRVRICPKSHIDIVKMCKRRNPMNHVSICMKKEAVLECGNYESILLLEDYYLWIKMIANGKKFANINECLVYVRIGNGFNEKRSSNKRIEGWKKLQKYMYEYKMISKFDIYINMSLIYFFVYSPIWIKKIIYSKILRKGVTL